MSSKALNTSSSGCDKAAHVGVSHGTYPSAGIVLVYI